MKVFTQTCNIVVIDHKSQVSRVQRALASHLCIKRRAAVVGSIAVCGLAGAEESASAV